MNPKNKLGPLWPLPLKLLFSLCPVHFQQRTCKIILADEIFNTISRRAEPNFFHMVLSHKTKWGNEGKVLHGRRSGETKKNKKTPQKTGRFMWGTLLQDWSAVKQDMKETLTSYSSRLSFDLFGQSVAENSSMLLILSSRWIFHCPVKPLHQTTLPAAKCQNPMDLGQRWYTHIAFST